MDQNLLSILSGGGIAIIASGVNFIFQSLNSNKKRKWDLEDRETEKKIKIKNDKIDQIEKLVTENFFGVSEILMLLSNRNNQGLFDPRELTLRIATTQNRLQYLSAMAKVLKDDDLDKKLSVFEGKFADFTSSIYAVWKNTNDESKRIEHTKKAGSLYGELQLPFMEIIKRLNEIRTNVSSIPRRQSPK